MRDRDPSLAAKGLMAAGMVAVGIGAVVDSRKESPELEGSDGP